MVISQLLAPSTWRTLGLCVGTGYIGLGTLAMTCQNFSAQFFGLLPPKSPQFAPSDSPTILISQTYPVQTSLILLGIRDFSIGAALIQFWRNGDDGAMATLILSGMMLCVADVVVVGKLNGLGAGVMLGVGAAFWAVVGAGLAGW